MPEEPLTHSIRLGNKDFGLERVKVPLSLLRLDPSNQRLSFLLKRRGSSSESDLHEMLWSMDAVKDLYTSILQNGGLINDPIVRRDGTVVEGNCRTVCLRQLHERYPEDPRWADLHVQMLPSEVSEEQLTMLIGELHIAGKIEWRAFEQAEYVWKMNALYGKSIDFLASHLRWSRGKVEQKIEAYQEAKEYLEVTGDPEGINRFSHFEEFMKKKELRDIRHEHPEFMRRFYAWVCEGRFPDAKDVRLLPDILSDTSTMTTFERDGLAAATAVLHNSNPALASNYWATIARAVDELRSTPLLELQDLQSGNSAKRNKLLELSKALDALIQQSGFRKS
jgi:hypothetical protein